MRWVMGMSKKTGDIVRNKNVNDMVRHRSRKECRW
jgi:hypothetical protein